MRAANLACGTYKTYALYLRTGFRVDAAFIIRRVPVLQVGDFSVVKPAAYLQAKPRIHGRVHGEETPRGGGSCIPGPPRTLKSAISGGRAIAKFTYYGLAEGDR